MLALLSKILSITLIDLTLSGDNAAVIGLAIKNLPKEKANKAAMIGAAGAVALRILFMCIATMLMTIPYLSAFGALLLVWITIKLIKPSDGKNHGREGNEMFWSAVSTIVIADVSMAFDNVMAVAGAAHGSMALIVLGIALSIPLLIWGSTYIADLMNKYPIIIYLGAAVLAHTAGVMFFHDKALDLVHKMDHLLVVWIPWILAIAVIGYGFVMMRRNKNAVSRSI